MGARAGELLGTAASVSILYNSWSELRKLDSSRTSAARVDGRSIGHFGGRSTGCRFCDERGFIYHCVGASFSPGTRAQPVAPQSINRQLRGLFPIGWGAAPAGGLDPLESPLEGLEMQPKCN
jgi:hypothetical protein